MTCMLLKGSVLFPEMGTKFLSEDRPGRLLQGYARHSGPSTLTACLDGLECHESTRDPEIRKPYMVLQL